MPKPSQNKVLRKQKDISQLMQQGKTSQEIMDLLGIPLRSYRRYTAAIHKQNQKAWYSLVRDELATELLKLRASLEESYHIALTLSKKPGLDTMDVLAALRAKDDSRLSQIQMLVEGLEWINKVEGQVQPKYHKVGQSKMMQQQHHP